MNLAYYTLLSWEVPADYCSCWPDLSSLVPVLPQSLRYPITTIVTTVIRAILLFRMKPWQVRSVSCPKLGQLSRTLNTCLTISLISCANIPNQITLIQFPLLFRFHSRSLFLKHDHTPPRMPALMVLKTGSVFAKAEIRRRRANNNGNMITIVC